VRGLQFLNAALDFLQVLNYKVKINCRLIDGQKSSNPLLLCPT
jgi:hypothetical protein